MNGRYNLFLPSVNCSCGKTLPVTISDLVESGYWPATVNFETLYLVDLFTTYEDLKITAPGMSRQAFVSMLECCTKLFGRSGKICGDTMQRAFLEWAYAKFEVDKLSQVQHFQCPACTPSMLAVAVDGNRKLYRFKSQPGPDGFFDGVFLANDAEVSSFVDYIHGTTGHNPGKGRCGAGQWTAARESANKSASKLDEEGVEVAVCRHGVLLKGLNMFRGEIFAYPLYLQKQLASQTVQFFCSDVVCKYWPYLQKVVDHCPELEDLLNMRPFLSIMHAKAHSWMCELNGGTQSRGAGTTIEREVEQVNSFLSQVAICSKYMSKAVRTDMLTIQASGWNKRKAENLDRTLAKRYIKVEKLNTLGYKAIVFIGKKTNKQKTWSAQVLQPKWQLSEQSEKCLDRMKALYELLINGCTNQQPTTSPPPIQSTIQPTTSPPPIQSTIQLTTSPPPIQSTIQPTTSPPPIQSTIQPTTSPPPIQSTIQPTTSPPPIQSTIQPTTSPPPIQSTIQLTTSPPPIQSTIQPTTSPPPIQPTIQPTTSPPPIQSTIQPTTSPPPIQSTIQPTTSPPPIQSTIQPTTSPPPIQSTIQLTTSPPILPITEPPQQKRECNHGILEGEPYYPVKRVIRCKKQKGIQMKLVEWEPCSLCVLKCPWALFERVPHL
ncbi:hypothetical protein QQF64_002764, partial [Cirrhinus molitorella]